MPMKRDLKHKVYLQSSLHTKTILNLSSNKSAATATRVTVATVTKIQQLDFLMQVER